MANILKSTFILAVIAFIASYALSHVNNITEPEILRQEKEKQQKALTAVLPGYSVEDEKTVKVNGGDFTYWTGQKGEGEDSARGYAFITEKSGYSGVVRTMVGIDDEGKILGVSILQQSETPGLGARSVEVASSETFWQAVFGSSARGQKGARPWFQEQFTGLDGNKPIEIVKKGDWNESMKPELLEKNAVSAITGATITTKTVKESIETGIEKFNNAVKTQNTAEEVSQ